MGVRAAMELTTMSKSGKRDCATPLAGRGLGRRTAPRAQWLRYDG